ncbi:unnamed protein product [Amoebophrya sp. A25]|nr:unnamed protein product [Amoebophrya sp. A25]|eukprot:GSA25T00026680001.1
MSRAADARSKKTDQKAQMAATRDRKAELLAMGLTSTMKKQIGDDRLLCTVCGATSRGPDKCTCPGGSSKPSDSYDATAHLIAAAKARHEAQKSTEKEANAKNQAEKERERAKKREGAGKIDLEQEFEDLDGLEIRQLLQFPVGKLGMDIERNVVVKVHPLPANAAELGVKVGWVISEVDSNAVPAKKQAIVTAITKVFKSGKPCGIRFRCPAIEDEKADGAWFCFRCDKFLAKDAFDSSSCATKTAAQRSCASCEECADMFDDDEDE